MQKPVRRPLMHAWESSFAWLSWPPLTGAVLPAHSTPPTNAPTTAEPPTIVDGAVCEHSTQRPARSAAVNGYQALQPA